jgi:hypothetical protein
MVLPTISPKPRIHSFLALRVSFPSLVFFPTLERGWVIHAYTGSEQGVGGEEHSHNGAGGAMQRPMQQILLPHNSLACARHVEATAKRGSSVACLVPFTQKDVTMQII